MADVDASPLNLRNKPKSLRKENLNDEFKVLTKQIKRLEAMQVENYRQIRKLHARNKALKETIQQLKEKRKQLAFVSVHISER